MAPEQQILNLYKEAGETPLECMERFRLAHKEYGGVPMTYAGRLDPLASGVLLVLASEARFKREEFLALPKEYEFECLWGISTDTYDPLGLITSISPTAPQENEIQKLAGGLVGKREQTYPLYSSKTVDGKSLFSIARGGRADEIEIPKKEIEIFSLKVIGSRKISGEKLLQEVKNKISKVQGDFRQAETIALWESSLVPFLKENFLITKMSAEVSSGTYIRSLVDFMGQGFGTGAIAYSIVRTRVGEYNLKDSIKT
jgi:tRNA pseudouridine55 synthase